MPYDPNQVREIIRERAAAYGLDPATMVSIAGIETGGTYNPAAANPKSSARGLFQFTTPTWGQYGKGDVNDPYANADAASRYTADNLAQFRAKTGRDPTPGETYLLHQQGGAGGTALLADPNRPAVEALAPFYRDPSTALQAITLNGGRPDMTAGQFADMWTKRVASPGDEVSSGANPQTITRSLALPSASQPTAGPLTSEAPAAPPAPASSTPNQAALAASVQSILQALSPPADTGSILGPIHYRLPPGIARERMLAAIRGAGGSG